VVEAKAKALMRGAVLLCLRLLIWVMVMIGSEKGKQNDRRSLLARG